MAKGIRFTVRKAYESWVLVGEDNQCLFLFDEPPIEKRLNYMRLLDYAERCVISDENSDVLTPHNLRFHRMSRLDKHRALTLVAKVMDDYYNERRG